MTTDPNEKHIAKPAYGQKPSVLDFTDLTMCANKVRQPGYWHVAPVIENTTVLLQRTWIPNPMSKGCKYDRKQIDPACHKAKCPRIGGNDAALD